MEKSKSYDQRFDSQRGDTFGFVLIDRNFPRSDPLDHTTTCLHQRSDLSNTKAWRSDTTYRVMRNKIGLIRGEYLKNQWRICLSIKGLYKRERIRIQTFREIEISGR